MAQGEKSMNKGENKQEKEEEEEIMKYKDEGDEQEGG